MVWLQSCCSRNSHRVYPQILNICSVLFPLSDQKNITAVSGQNVTLTCRAPNNNLIAVNWSRADLGEKYVLLYRDGHFEPHNQHPSLKNRVDLQGRQMKDGDVSLILKNVTTNDTGTYECRVFVGEPSSWKSINTTYLRVDPPGWICRTESWSVCLWSASCSCCLWFFYLQKTQIFVSWI
uniref:Ig-like domain-containing protein n=1 Tax=Oreochromis aureus TaxID=47969 RepID=A0A668RUQ4_OREAU